MYAFNVLCSVTEASLVSFFCFDSVKIHGKYVGRRQKYNGTGNSVPFPFNFRAVAVLVRFQTVPVLSQGQPVRSA